MLKLFQDVLIHDQQYKLFHVGKDRNHCFKPNDGGKNLEFRYDEVLQMQVDGDLVELHRELPHADLHKSPPKLKAHSSSKRPSSKGRAK